MPNTKEVPLTSVQPVQGGTPAEPSEDSRVLALTRLAFRIGTESEPGREIKIMIGLFMDNFVSPVQNWCRSHAAKVAMCYISIYKDTPSVFVIGSKGSYDYSLSEPLANLEMDLHRRGFPCSVLQLPSGTPELLRAFLDEANAIQISPQ